MGKKDRPKKNRYRAVIAIVIAGIVFLTFPRAEERNFRELLTENAELELLNALCPVIAAAGDNGRLSVSGWIFPFLGYQSKTKTAQLAQENSDMVEKILLAEGRDEYTGMPAVLSANSAGSLSDHRSSDRRGGSLSVPRAGPYKHFAVTNRPIFP